MTLNLHITIKLKNLYKNLYMYVFEQTKIKAQPELTELATFEGYLRTLSRPTRMLIWVIRKNLFFVGCAKCSPLLGKRRNQVSHMGKEIFHMEIFLNFECR